jgi:hypothetical protein
MGENANGYRGEMAAAHLSYDLLPWELQDDGSSRCHMTLATEADYCRVGELRIYGPAVVVFTRDREGNIQAQVDNGPPYDYGE